MYKFLLFFALIYSNTSVAQELNAQFIVNANLVNAQQARRVLDRLVGFELSPVLWRKVKQGLSAGRVQSVAVRLIVERENEIVNLIYEQGNFYYRWGWIYWFTYGQTC